MKGNPHAESVNNGIQHVRDLIGKREMYQREGMGLILEAQSRMAVAHEVRTMALVTLLTSGSVFDTEYADLLHEIRRGLGHA